jgi:CheY-like chemotaxis protein
MNPDTLAGRTILLMEDNEAARQDWSDALRGEGSAVATAADGREALALLGGGLGPDLIVLDMLTPGVDGWRFLERRQRDPALASVPVVITTGLGVACAEWAGSLGAAGYLHKPFDAEDLVREVRRCLADDPQAVSPRRTRAPGLVQRGDTR